MGRTIPGAPMLSPSVLLRAPEPVPHRRWFSFERHALLAVLEWLGRRGGNPLDTVAVPDYMCHEVVATLREKGYRVAFFPLETGFNVDPARVEAALGSARAAVLMCHFYGRLVRRWDDLAGLCRRRGWPLLEDCAHLPFPFPQGAEPFVSDARLYTFRKLYGVPYGAAAVLREGQEDFEAFLDARGAPRVDPDGPGVLRWAARELAKRAVVASGLRVARGYHDLSQDPLKDFDRAHPLAERLLPAGAWREAVARRRENALAYQSGADLFSGWAEPLAFDLERDVPYQWLLTLAPGVPVQAFLAFFLARGVAARRGLALHSDVLSRLPVDHPYNRQVSLPLHQDVSGTDVREVLALVRLFRGAQGQPRQAAR